jgi:NodT family efflux transporter outer membrane factor (OMF) lipoprotein
METQRQSAQPRADAARHPRLSIAAMLAAVWLTGCASSAGLAPQARAASPAQLQAARTLAAAPLQADAWPGLQWWAELGDAGLNDLEAEALAHSPTLQLAQARVAKAQALADMARATRLPHLDADAAATRQRYTRNGVIPPPYGGTWQTDGRATLDFGYELDFWHRNGAALAAALSTARAAEVDALAARLMLSVGIAHAYVQLARDYDQLDIANTTLADRRHVYALTQQRVNAGLDSHVELKQAEAALPAAREDIATLNESIALTRNELAALLGAGPDRGLEIPRPRLAQTAPVATLPSRLPADLLGRRPDVVASRWRVQAASQDIDAAKAQFYPDVNLLAFAGFQSIGLSQLLDAGSRVAGAGPALRLPLFDAGRLRGNLAARDADYDAAVEQYNATLVSALREVGDRLAAVRAVAALSMAQQQAIDAATEAYDLAVLRYREGLRNYLSVLSAEAPVLVQKRLAADLRARAFDNQIDLVRAVGGGLSYGNESPPQVTAARTPS